MKNNCFKRLVSLLAVVAIMFTLMTVTVFAGSAFESKSSVVAVLSEDGSSMGSGFAIGKPGKPVEFIVTNNHVVKGDAGLTTATVFFDLASNEAMNANVYFFDAAKDVAVLKLPQPTEKREPLVLCPMEDVDPDDEFAALGYPGDQVTDWPKYNMDDITITKGGIKKTDRLAGRDVYMLDLTVTNGNSGGPLVNSKGEVVGIPTFGLGENNYAIVIDELISVINRDKIPYALHGDINWLLIAAIVLLLLIIALVVVLVVSKTRKTPPEGTEGHDGPGGQTQPLYPPQPPKPTARVIAVGGTMNGKRYEVTGVIRIGRNSARCGIAFPVNTQGVSAEHCEITYNGSMCCVTDLNSSYGTFTSDGRKLAPNQPHFLKSGEKFYLAIPENTFEVRY